MALQLVYYVVTPGGYHSTHNRLIVGLVQLAAKKELERRRARNQFESYSHYWVHSRAYESDGPLIIWISHTNKSDNRS